MSKLVLEAEQTVLAEADRLLVLELARFAVQLEDLAETVRRLRALGALVEGGPLCR